MLLSVAAAALGTGRASAGEVFTEGTVLGAARDLAARPFVPQDTSLPADLSKLSYEQYRTIRFNSSRGLWAGTDAPYHIEFYHRGFIFPGEVGIAEVDGGRAQPIRYRKAMFDFGKVQPPDDQDYGFAGFRIQAPLHRPGHFAEAFSFLGGSYFRGVAKGLTYGLSARGLAIKTGKPTPEEFPYFKAFWIVRPSGGPLAIHALLDSVSCTGAFRFLISPGTDTVVDVEATIFPRVEMNEVGIAPLTSMFFFDSSDRWRAKDWRPAVHDSDGLLMRTKAGETLWRALENPRTVQISAFADIAGFGLMQRKRRFEDYQDLGATYHTRPSCWVEPKGDWGPGNVILTEIPTDSETNDNIVAFWRPREPLRPGLAYQFGYKLHWSAQAPITSLPPFTATMGGVADNIWTFVLDVAGLHTASKPELDITADKGKLVKADVQRGQSGWRINIELDAGNEKTIELRARLTKGGRALTETWLYRWTGA